ADIAVEWLIGAPAGMSITPENSSAGWPSFGEHFITPENSSAGWPSFGEHFTTSAVSRWTSHGQGCCSCTLEARFNFQEKWGLR
ncbi:hypothetical protein, partial [Bradyrhizobium shewense]|uniref:hypothetical protein n=1 Tax=Bradyrhizobium shewense TaxID=1761772 RepID=UPI001ABF07CA